MRRIKVEIDMIKRQKMHQTTNAESDVWQNCEQYSTDIANGTLTCVYANNIEYLHFIRNAREKALEVLSDICP